MEKEFEEITFWPIDSNDRSGEFYYQIRFRPDHKFIAYNLPGCGIDCVVQVYGNFSSTDTTTQFTVEETRRFKGCSGRDTLAQDIGTYYVVKDAYSLRLVKNLDDEPKENYFEQSDIKFPDFKDEAILKMLRKYVYLYNRIYQIVVNKNDKKYSIVKREALNWTYGEAYAYTKMNKADAFHALIGELDRTLQALYTQIAPQ